MANKTVLYVEKDGRLFFVIAEPMAFAEKVPFVDSETKEVLNPSQVKYKLTELQNGKKYKILGFVKNIKVGRQYLRIGKPVFFNNLKAIEFNTEWIFIYKKVFEC